MALRASKIDTRARAGLPLRWLTAASIVLAMLPTLLGPDPASAADTAAPTVAVSVPTPDQAFESSPVTLTGSASDDVGVAGVTVAIQDRQSKQWLQADGSFGSWNTRLRDAALASPGATSTAWSFTFDPQRAGQFGAQMQALDPAGNESFQVWRRFSIAGTGGSDTAAPTVAVSVPTPDQAFESSPVTLTGSASDDVGVTGVTVAIQDRQSKQWLQADGSFGSWNTRLRDAALASPGATSTAWSFTFDPQRAGQFGVQAQTLDAAGNESFQVWRRFSITGTPTTRPNVVIVLTDDQRWDDMLVMDATLSAIGDRGTTFTNSFVANPWCCPSRATLLTGQYSHTNGVYRNSGSYGGVGAFRDDTTLATALDAAGYRTSLIGKYLNGYTGTGTPPGWDDWHVFSYGVANSGGAYYNYSLTENGVVRAFGDTAADYSTDVLADRAVSFIRSTQADEPLFLLYSPYAPHGFATPAPRHVGQYASMSIPTTPNFNEADVSDKPAWVRNLPLSSQTPETSGRRTIRETLLAVDEAVTALVSALQETGRLSNTLLIFTSDNGFSRGEHRWWSKQAAYEELIRVPLLIRYDPYGSSPREADELVQNVDLAPTIAAVTGVPVPGTEGSNLAPLLQGSTPPWRSEILVEHLKGFTSDPVPSYCAVRTMSEKYVRYSTGEQEYYDLSNDPYELVSRADDPAFANAVAHLDQRAQELCSPPPPGFTF